MKMISLLLVASLSRLGAQFGDDNPGGEWLPVPDGYVWPAVEEGAPRFTPLRKRWEELAIGQRKVVKEAFPEGKAPESVEVAEVDLNGDGWAEIFVGVPELSGTGGPFYVLFTSKDGKSYEGMGEVQGSGFQFLPAKMGWRQFSGVSRGGGGQYARFLMSFSGRHYEIVRCERHDFNAGKVTIATPLESQQ
ncbi:FG-GAP repeat protein [Roseibacillus ishigakijimensis]|uniref:Uncharacterized protein n=1 Tax=Roseibacillus ishigakijimensis TaxID=454146 RepID=A0A934RNU3_9BACT|nr:FG-GAP repeat protein [Roseibacillus ishigakijimensis]MBK1832753.1 hypothetical protein [Roseibacillus ishigakijimensis]